MPTKKLNILVVLICGLIPALLSQLFISEPATRKIHVRNFRYGKDPSVIRIHRGDTLKLSFSTDDTGHSFYLEEFDVDAKVSPARELVEVFSVSDPTEPPYSTDTVTIVARHPGLLNYLVSKSYFRCHVWCGPMHAFEHGKLVLMPNTLLAFSLGSLIGILLIWLTGFRLASKTGSSSSKTVDLFSRWPFLQKALRSRWPQLILMLLAMFLVYLVILAAFFGTKMSGRNLGVLLMWAVWLFLLVAVMTPFFGRIWCTVCPLPFFGDLLQRGTAFGPGQGKRGKYRNPFKGLFRPWPRWLSKGWGKLILLLLLTSFSTTLVAHPKVTGLAILALVVLPTVLAPIFEHRAFCRYLCPVSVFIGSFSRLSPLAIRNRDQKICDRCKNSYCEFGGKEGWACPYGLNVGQLEENTECGLCLECTRSCPYDNVTLYSRPFALETGARRMSEAWTILAVFTVAIVYCILYQGHWPFVRDMVNILDKKNWDLFAIFSLAFWLLSLLVVPGMVYGLAILAKRRSGTRSPVRDLFKAFSGAMLPMGLMLWIAFVIPMLFVNTTFVLQSLSDPFGWGWDLFGTTSLPWQQFLPRFFPWIQAILVLTGTHLSLRNLRRSIAGRGIVAQSRKACLPMAAFIILSSFGMLLFFTN